MRARTGRATGSTVADCGQDTTAQHADGDAAEDSESVDEHVADFERPARYQLLAKLQGYAQQDHGESQHDREGPALDRQERQPGVAAEVQHFQADGPTFCGALSGIGDEELGRPGQWGRNLQKVLPHTPSSSALHPPPSRRP